MRACSPARLPALSRSPAVFVDGQQNLRVVSKNLDAANGWWTASAPDDPSAPFNNPFSLIL